MAMNRNRNNKRLMLFLLILGIAFATVATTLYINGSATISKNSADFDVRFTKAINGENDISSTAISADGRSIVYETSELIHKDDESVLTYTVTNNSSLYDANVSVSCTTGSHNDLYSVTNSLDSVVEAKSSKDGTVTVKLLQDAEEEINEEFTCTLTATAIERTEANYDNCTNSMSNENIVAVMNYKESSGSDYCEVGTEESCHTPDFCVTGDEETCTEYCSNSSTIPVGTIIKYKVNPTTTRTFFVMKDEGEKLLLQDKENIADGISWYGDYANSSDGPITALTELESKTEGWTNVNTQVYTINDSYYTLENRTAKARLITKDELDNLGCSFSSACPIWVYNQRTFGSAYGYWTSTSCGPSTAYTMMSSGSYVDVYTNRTRGVRAVIEINK